jgi:DNA polymerase-3 subunit delta
VIYLLYGLETFLIEREVKNILKEKNISDIDINTYDLSITLIDNILEDAMMISLFGDNKAIIVSDSYIFTGVSKKGEINHNLDMLVSYLKDPNPNTLIIFIVNSEKLDERKKIVKLIKESGVVKDFNKPNNINSIVKELFEDYNISNENINLLIDRVGKNLGILDQEISKIKIYKDTDKQINADDIFNLTCKTIDTDLFELIEHIVAKNKGRAIEIYKEMLKLNEEPIKIIVILANQIRIIYQTKELYKKGYTEKDIASNLNIHPYRIRLALQKSREYESSALLQHLNDLADLDINIKSGLIDKNLGLELFILGL